MEKLGVAPGECAVVDDGLYRGIKIASKLGCETYWIDKNDEMSLLTEIKRAEINGMTTVIGSVVDLIKLLE